VRILAGLRQQLRLRFDADALESRYQLDALPSQRKSLVAVLVVAGAFQAINIPADYTISGGGDAFRDLMLIRVASVALVIAGIVMIRRQREPGRFERVAMWWGIFTAIGVVASFALLPPTYTEHTAWSVFLVLAMYVTLPISMVRQASVAGIFTIGDAIILWNLKVLDVPAARVDIMLAHACAHAIGVVASWQFRRSRRDQFLAYREAELAHTHEQRALGELSVLQGILPICSHCKRIRNEDGQWSQVEVYVRRHSEADFTHGICPDCEQKFFESQG
jgi:hypothetical protein